MPSLSRSSRSFALCLLLLVHGCALACGPLRVGFRPGPATYDLLPGGGARGIDVDFIAELSKRTGCSVEARLISSKMVDSALGAGEIDILPSALHSPLRESLGDMLPLGASRMGLLVHKAWARGGHELRELTQDPQATVLVVRGAVLPPVVKHWLNRPELQSRITEAGDLPAALRAFEAGRAVAMPVFAMQLHGKAALWKSGHRLWDPWPEFEVPIGVLISRKTVPAELRGRLREAIEAMQRDGTLQRIVHAHLGPETSRFFVLAGPKRSAPATAP